MEMAAKGPPFFIAPSRIGHLLRFAAARSIPGGATQATSVSGRILLSALGKAARITNQLARPASYPNARFQSYRQGRVPCEDARLVSAYTTTSCRTA